jgi:hypothetical protein
MAGGKTNGMENDWLNYEFRGDAYAVPGSKYAGLFTVSPDPELGTGGTEVSGGAYARQQLTRATTTWNASTTGSLTNAAGTGVVTFPTATAAWGRVMSLGLWDALTVGNLRYLIPLVDPTFGYKNFAVSDITNDDIVCPGHVLAANDVVRFFPVGGTLPGGITNSDTRLFVIATGLTTDTFRVSATQGGAALNISSVGRGEVAKDASFDVVLNSQLSFAAGTITVGDD